MATDATGTPTAKGIPTYDTANDAPSGLGFNAAMQAIDALLGWIKVRINSGGSSYERSRLNVVAGDNVSLGLADDAGSDEVDLTIATSTGLTHPADLLLNGSLGIWQRGVGPYTANGYTADCWEIVKGAGSTISVVADTTTTVNAASFRSMQITYTHGSAETRIRNRPTDHQQARGKVSTFRLSVKAALGSAIRIGIDDGVSTTYSSYHTGNGAWQTLVVSKTVSDSNNQLTCFVSLNAGTGAVFNVDNGDLILGPYAATATNPPYFSADPSTELDRVGWRYRHIAVNARFQAGGAGEVYSFPVYFGEMYNEPPTITLFTAGTRTNVSNVSYVLSSRFGGRVDITAAAAGPTSVYNEVVAIEANP